MRHQKAGRKLGVLPDHRRALMRNLTLAIMEHESIRTTVSRAKALRPYADHMVTLAKYGDVPSRRRMVQILGSTQTHSTQNRVRQAIEKMYATIAPRFKDRAGGYTQILRLAARRAGDNAEMCVIRYLPSEDDAKKPSGKNKKAAKPEPKKKMAAAEGAQDQESKKSKKAPEDKKVSDKSKKKEKEKA